VLFILVIGILNQGDQIGRIFAQWPIFHFEQFLIIEVAQNEY
jgi:hypothetical protein